MLQNQSIHERLSKLAARSRDRGARNSWNRGAQNAVDAGVQKAVDDLVQRAVDAGVKKTMDAGVQKTENEGVQKAEGLSKKWAFGHFDKLLGAGLMGGGALLAKKYIVPKPSMFKRVTDSMHGAIGFGLGGLALGAGVLGATKAYNVATTPYIKQKHFDEMLKENPALKHEDRATVEKSYNTLFHFNKDMATDPTTAGAFVRRAVAFKDEGIQANDIKTLAEIRKNMADARGKNTSFISQGSDLFNFRDKE